MNKITSMVIDIPLNKIIVLGNNPRQSFDDESIRRLGESIKNHGQAQNIVVRPKGDDYELVVGERRLRACAMAGLPTIRAEVRELNDIATYELKLIENVHREDLSDAEKGDAVYQLWAFDKYETIKDVCESLQIPYNTVKNEWLPKTRKLSEKIKSLSTSARTSFSDFHARVVMKYPHSVQNRLADISVERQLTSRQLQELTKLYDAEPKTDLTELTDKLLNVKKVEKVEIPLSSLTEEQKKILGKSTVKKPGKPRTKPSKPKKKDEIKKEKKPRKPFRFKKIKITPKKKEEVTPPLPPDTYNIIYADPPWKYDFSETDSRSIEAHYSSMELDDIKTLSVDGRSIKDVTADNAVLFLWATNPKLEEALEVIEAWDFKYKTNMVWIKDKIGMGYWFRGQHELLLIATKGNFSPPEPEIRKSSVLEAPRLEHSAKPHEVYDMIESYFPDGKYLELFSRNKREKWEMW